MHEPILFGLPVSLLFLYFIFYSFVGWAMETTYCSVLERHFVIRGFLYGPICPIYGVGALMMVLFFQPLTGNLLVFYIVSTVSMSAWEYFVGWFLEVTTHMKYWDYSHHRFNLHGRISLFICLWWGVLSYITIYWIHPAVSGLFDGIPNLVRQILASVLFVIIATDAVFTIRNLALTAKLMRKLEQASDELALQLTLAKAEVRDRLEDAKDDFNLRKAEARAEFDTVVAEAREGRDQRLAAFREKQPQLWDSYEQLQEKAERYTRHLRHSYRKMSASRYAHSFNALKRDADTIRQRVIRRREENRANKKRR